MRHYTQPTLEQRYQIQALLKIRHRYSEITRVVGVHTSPISREVRCNRGLRGYRSQQAQHLTLNRRDTKTRPRIAAETWHLVDFLPL